MKRSCQATIWEVLGQAGSVVSHSERETLELGRRIGKAMAPRTRSEDGGQNAPVLLLEGEMGAGKTVLVRGIAEGLGLDPSLVQSPTFTLMNEYQDSERAVRLVHCDLYRLEPEEVESTGLLDLLAEGAVIVVVEWADRLPEPIGYACTLQMSRLAGEKGEGLRRIEGIGLAVGS